MAEIAEYGVETDFYFPLIKAGAADFAGSGDYTHNAGDTKISKDGGAANNTSNAPSAIAMGNASMWKLTLTATEMQAAKIKVIISDAATKAIEDQMLTIDTYGNASAQHAFNLNTATQPVNVTQIDAQATTGNNATLNLKQLNIVNSGGTALIAQSTGSNGHGIHAEGNATGSGLYGKGGNTTGNGFYADGQSAGVSGYGFLATNTLGDAVHFRSDGGNGDGLHCRGDKVGAGFEATGGNDGHGVEIAGGLTTGDGINIITQGTGDGIVVEPGTGHGINVVAAGTTQHAVRLVGAGTGDGIEATGGADGNGMTLVGGSSSGNGLGINSATSTALRIASSGGNGNGASLIGNGSGNAMQLTAGATGNGLRSDGGSTSGHAVDLNVTSGSEVDYGGTELRAAVNAEVADVLKTDTVTLPGQTAPSATPTMEDILGWLYKTFRNKKTQSASEWALYDDAGSTIDSKATVSDNGTVATKEEIVTGP